MRGAGPSVHRGRRGGTRRHHTSGDHTAHKFYRYGQKVPQIPGEPRVCCKGHRGWFSECWVNVGAASSTLAQHQP